MNDFLKRVAVVASSSLFLLSVFTTDVHAQNAVGLQLKPAIVEDQVTPGETHQYSLTVTNVSKAPGTFYLETQDIKGVDDEGRPVFANKGEVTGFELSSWVTLGQETVVLNAGETKTINFTMHVPTDASPGSHFASLFFNDKPVAPSTSGTGVGFDVGAILSFRIAGDIREEAQLREFSTKKLIYPNGNIDFNTKVENLGNVLVQPTGIIQITNMFGKEVGTAQVNSSVASVFPKASRAFSSTWSSDSFTFGRYEAIVSLSYGSDAKKTIYSTTSFWVLPLKPILIILGILFFIVIFFYLLMRSYIRRKLRQMGVTNTTSRADTDFYQKKYGKSGSKLVIVTMAVLLACVIFLIILFLMFA
jgi:hypothetical protein